MTLNWNGTTLRASTNAAAGQKAAFISAVTTVNVKSGGAIIDANGQDITVVQPLLHDAALGATPDGGLTKIGAGTLSLVGANTYTGPTTINGGKVNVVAPYAAVGSSVVVNSGARLRVTAGSTPSQLPAVTLNDGGGIEFNLGTFNPANPALLTNATLIVPNGTTNFIDIAGVDIPVTNIVLVEYTNKTGSGVFQLGTLPTAMAATLTDTGSKLVLNVTAPSANLYTWSIGTGNWELGGALNWNSGAAAYSQPAVVVFPDNAGGTVTVTTNVSPFDMDVLVTSLGVYTFTGPGSIDGATGIDIQGISTVTLANSNNFTGLVTVSGGSGTVGATLFIDNPKGLGATNGGVVISGPANTLELGTVGGNGVTVVGESVTINGTGVGGARGALRGAAVAAGQTNIWAGPVVIGSSNARIGAEDAGNIIVAGNITDNGAGLGPVIRPGGSSAFVTLSGSGNSWSGNTTLFGSDASSKVVAGVNNPIPTNSPLFIGSCTFELDGFNQTSPGLGLASSGISNLTALANNSLGASTMTINGTNAAAYSGDITGNLSIVKDGPNTQTFTGANQTYTGTTIINGGRLNISSVNPLSSSITVNAGGAIGGEFTTTGTLTLNANGALNVDPNTPASIVAASASSTGSPVLVGFTAAPPVGTPVLVLTAAGGISGGTSNYQATGVRGGTFYLTNSNTELMFVAAAGAAITWKGNNSTNPTFWDVITTTNWDNAGNADVFFTGDAVRFDDTATTFNVAIQGTLVSPASVTFSNTANPYTVAGGSISGATSLVKQGTNSLTLSAFNGYTGGTVITGGQLIHGADGHLGTAPVTLTHSNIFLNGGGLVQATANLAMNTNRGIGIGGAGGALENQGGGNWTLPVPIEGPGQLTLNSITPGSSFLLNYTNTYSGGSVFVGSAGGFVYPIVSSVGSPGSLVSGPFGTGPVTFNGPGMRSTTAAATTLGNNITLAADVNFPTVASEKTLTFSGPVTLSGGDRILSVAVGATVPTESLVISGPIGQATPGLGLVKTGTGKLILAGTNSYTGATVVSNGTLAISATALITNTPTISVVSPGTMDVSAAPFTLGNSQTLQGSGTVTGDVTANGRIAPAMPGALGTLTFNNNLVIGGNLTFKVATSFAPSNDVLQVNGLVLTNAGSGTLTVSNLGPALAVGDYFKLFNKGVSNGQALTIAGPAGVTFANNLAVDGSVSVLSISTPPTIPTAPTNVTFSITSSNITLGWPSNYVGWILQTQTNSRSLGLKTNWFDVPGSQATNVMSFPVNKLDPTVFFRLARTNQP
jgi:autotransporter-associated beta strand protein